LSRQPLPRRRSVKSTGLPRPFTTARPGADRPQRCARRTPWSPLRRSSRPYRDSARARVRRRTSCSQRRHPTNHLQTVGLEKRHHLAERIEPGENAFHRWSRGGKLGHVKVNRCRRSPGGIEDERRGRKTSLPKLGDGIADLAAAAPDIGGDPGTEHPGRWESCRPVYPV